MHPYIPHLLSDIVSAHQRNPVADKLPSTIEEELEAIESWVAGDQPRHTFGYHCGLEAVNFPPAEQLTDEDMAVVCEAFEKMMYTWNLTIDLPKTLPQHLKYFFIIKTLDEETTIVSSGFMTFDYCNGDAPSCIFKEFCSCLKYWDKGVFIEDFDEDKKD